MGWMEYLKKLPLAEIWSNIKVELGGIINVKFENHHYHFDFHDSSQFLKVQKEDITPDLDKIIKKEVANRLAPIEKALNAVQETTMKEVVVSTSLAIAPDAIHGTLAATLAPIKASIKGTVGPSLSGKPENQKKN